MKHQLKKILLLYLLTGTLFVSCTMEEEVIRKHNYSKDIKIYQKSFDELIKDSKFATSFNKLPKKKSTLQTSTQARTVMEEQYGFTITNTPARVMQVGKITSYTFHIERENNNPSFFENLVIQNDSIGNTTAHIIKYTPFIPMTAFAEHNSYSFEGETEFTSIIYDDTQVNTSGRMVTVCRNLYRTMCNGRIGGLGGDCTASTHVYNTICSDTTPNCIFQQFLTETCTTYDDGESEGGTGGGGTGGGTGTGGGGGTDPVYSDPVPDNNYIAAVDAPFTTPCEQLKTLLNDTNKQAIEYLETKANDTKEWGYSFQTFPNSTNLAPPSVIQADEREPTKIKMSACTGGNYVGAFHTHPIPSAQGIVPMFSPGDFKWLRDVALNHAIPHSVKNYNTYFLTLTVQSGTYAIKIKDINKFVTFYGTKYDEFQEKLKDKYRDMNGSESDENELMIALLEKLTNSGIGLYELNDNKTNWSEVTLNPLSNTTPKKTPCK